MSRARRTLLLLTPSAVLLLLNSHAVQCMQYPCATRCRRPVPQPCIRPCLQQQSPHHNALLPHLLPHIPPHPSCFFPLSLTLMLTRSLHFPPWLPLQHGQQPVRSHPRPLPRSEPAVTAHSRRREGSSKYGRESSEFMLSNNNDTGWYAECRAQNPNQKL